MFTLLKMFLNFWFKEMKSLRSLKVKAEAYLESKQAAMMEFFYEYSQRLTIFAIKAPS